MTLALPRFAVIKSTYNSKYLSYIKDDGETRQFLKFSGDEVVSPLAKYAIEPAKSGNGLVHIRCCYNNKYWARWTIHWWIIAGADQKEEDQSKSTCTLFEPLYVDDAKTTIRFRHVQLGHYVNLMPVGGDYDSCLYANSATPDGNRYDLLTITDWESLVILPKHVAFKGSNGSFLGGVWAESHQYLQFATDDMADERAGHEIFTNGDGSIHIKCNHFSRFWRAVPDWIWADTTDITNNNDSDLLFWPIKVSDNVIALRNMNNNKFCQMVNMDNKTRCLRASADTISANARMEVYELVLSRSIYNVTFRLEEARIYDESVLTMAKGIAINKGEHEENIEVSVTYSKSSSTSWNASVSLSLGVSTTLETGVPFIAEGKVTISTDISAEYKWGTTTETSTVLTTSYSVPVPPMSITTVSYLGTRGTCSVPFSYTQRDTFVDGTQNTYTMDDGEYTGINSYNLHFQSSNEKL